MRHLLVVAVTAFLAAFTVPASAQECPKRAAKWNILDAANQRGVDAVRADVRIGMYKRAANAIRPLLRTNPKNADGWQTLGRVELLRGNTPEAVAAFECALKLGLHQPSIHLDYAVALFQGYRVRDARRAMRRFRRKFPTARTSELLAEFPRGFKATLPL